MSPLQCSSLAEVLKQEFSRRKERSARYSLRTFARDLELSPSRLSEVLKGKQGLSEANSDAVARKLTRRPGERAFIKDLVLANSARNHKVRELARARLNDAREAAALKARQEDQFKLVADWYHPAILAMTQLVDFQANPAWIAGRLGISLTAAEGALARLQKMGALKTGGGRYVANPEGYRNHGEVPASACRKFHRRIHAMHSESLIAGDSKEQELISAMVALPRSRMPEFKRRLQEFMASFLSMSGDEPKDELYSLSLQLCPVRKREAKGTFDA